MQVPESSQPGLFFCRNFREKGFEQHGGVAKALAGLQTWIYVRIKPTKPLQVHALNQTCVRGAGGLSNVGIQRLATVTDAVKGLADVLGGPEALEAPALEGLGKFQAFRETFRGGPGRALES